MKPISELTELLSRIVESFAENYLKKTVSYTVDLSLHILFSLNASQEPFSSNSPGILDN